MNLENFRTQPLIEDMGRAYKERKTLMRGKSRQDLITEALLSGKSRNEVYAMFLPMVESQIKPWVFSANVHGTRVPKSMGAQLNEFLYAINRIAAKLNRPGTDFTPGETSDVDTPTPVEETPKPVASGKKTLRDRLEAFHAEITRLREFCSRREMAGETVDTIGVRWAEAGGKLIPAGVPGEAIIGSATIHWPTATRQEAGIDDFDFVSLSREIMREREIETVTRRNGDVEIAHAMFGYVLTLLENRQPVYAYGPHGTGKSHVAKQVADYLDLPYAESPISPGATRGDLLGRHTATGFIAARFVEIYSGGGVFNFEEIDSGDPAMLLVLNNALASQSLYNPLTGETHDRHPDFCAFATANTLGLGANRSYTGREKIDAATLDRWNCGRVRMEVDTRVERSILGL